jgi:hypothetical protein
MARPTVDFIPTEDVLRRDPTLAYAMELPVLGIGTRFETNSRYVHGVIEGAFGAWRAVDVQPDAAFEAALRVRVIVHDGTELVTGRAPVRHIWPDRTRTIVHSPGSVAIVDPAHGEAVAYVTTALAGDREHFRALVLEAMTLAALTSFDRHPVHAAAVRGDRRAVMLAAPSGTGKSTLAYLAHRAGLHVLSEDHVWIQRSPKLRLWGWPGPIHLREETRAGFPELALLRPSPRGEGEPRLAVHATSDAEDVLFADDLTLCVLERGAGPVMLERMESGALATMLRGQIPAGFDRFPERQEDVIAAITRNGGWRLRLSKAPLDALPLLMRMVDD